MFKRKLAALKYPAKESFNPDDVQQFQNLILWLEDQKIRHYKIEDRNGLRQLGGSNWNNAYMKYLTDVGHPFPNKSKTEVLEWLLGWAVHLEYGDNVNKYEKQAVDEITNSSTALSKSKSVTANPLDNLDFSSPEFIEGVKKLAQQLEINAYTDHLVMLKAISQLVVEKLSKSEGEKPETKPEGQPYPIQSADLGFDTGDYVLNQAAKVLRLLYIRDLRNLQTSINECIVAVQGVTADPKTDTKLGKVGK